MLIRRIYTNTLFLTVSSLAINAVLITASQAACPKLPDTISTTVTETCYLGDGKGISVTETGRIEKSNPSDMSLDSGIVVLGAATKIINSGHISGADDSGVLISNGYSLADGIINNSTGTIHGDDHGIDIQGSGSIISGGIDNHGIINGENFSGIRIFGGASLSGGILNGKTGVIHGGESGVLVDNASHFSGDITNHGTISGGDYALNLQSGSSKVINYGTLDGNVSLDDWLMEIRGTESRITGAVTGNTNSLIELYGSFTSENTFDVGQFYIMRDAQLNLRHNVKTTNNGGMINFGTLNIADGETITIDGDYGQYFDGTLRIGATSASQYGKLVVTGTADLDNISGESGLTGSGKFDVQVSANDRLANGDRLDNVLSAGTLNVGDTELTVTDNSALWSFIVVDDGNNGIDLITQYHSLASIADVPAYAQGAAQAIDAIYQANSAQGDMATVLGELNALSTHIEVAQAVQQMVPMSAHTGHKISVLSNTAQISRVMEEQVTGVQLAFAPQAVSQYSDVQFAALGVKANEKSAPRGFWIRPFYQKADQGMHDGIEGYDAYSRGLVLGFDAQISDEWKIGTGLAYASTKVHGKQDIGKQSSDIDSYELVGFGQWQPSERDYVNITAAAGITRSDSARSIQFGSLNRTATAKHDGWYGQFKLEAGRHYSPHERLTLTPIASANYIHLREDSYTEQGAGALNLNVEGDSTNALLLGLGGQMQYQPDPAKPLFLKARLGVTYDALSEQESTQASFSGGGSSFTTQGLDTSPWAFRAGIDVDMLSSNGMTLNLGYDVEARSNYLSQIISANVKVEF